MLHIYGATLLFVQEKMFSRIATLLAGLVSCRRHFHGECCPVLLVPQIGNESLLFGDGVARGIQAILASLEDDVVVFGAVGSSRCPSDFS